MDSGDALRAVGDRRARRPQHHAAFPKTHLGIRIGCQGKLQSFDIKAAGELATSSSYPEGAHADLPERSIADSLKVLADGKVAVCTLLVGGISIFDSKGGNEFINFADPMTTNLAFGGKDMRDTWVTLSGTGRIAKVRWPYPGLKPAFTA